MKKSNVILASGAAFFLLSAITCGINDTFGTLETVFFILGGILLCAFVAKIVVSMIKGRAAEREFETAVMQYDLSVGENIPKVREQLRKHGISASYIHIGETPIYDEKFNLLKLADGRWEAFYGEHGQKSNPRVFDTAEEAAEYLIQRW